MTTPPPGGFLPTNPLLSPPTSTTSSQASPLPHPRSTPLKSGGPKESTLIRYLDDAIGRIRREVTRRTLAVEDEKGGKRGYRSFREAAHDIDKLVDVVWVSGTPSIQVPYLMNLAHLIITLLPELPPAPKQTFNLLRKTDHAFVSLLQGRDIDTGETLPGFASGPKVTGTEKVRIKSLAERTRIVITEVMSNPEWDEEPGEAKEETDDEDFNMDETTDDDKMDVDKARRMLEEEEDEWGMDVARVYDKTMVELGDTIGASPVAMITDDWDEEESDFTMKGGD